MKSCEKELIRSDLISQLNKQGKTMAFYKNLVEDYMHHLEIKEKLIADIKKRGLRYTVTNGNGIESEKPNESVQLLQKETVTMLKILSELNLKEPVVDEQADDVDGYM